MQRLISERIKREQEKIKSSAQASKKLSSNNKNALKNEQLKQEKSAEVKLAKEAQTLMLDV